MTKLQRNIYEAVINFSHFTKTNFDIDIQNTQKLYNELNDNDQKMFCFDMEKVNFSFECSGASGQYVKFSAHFLSIKLETA